mgnify:CR=1
NRDTTLDNLGDATPNQNRLGAIEISKNGDQIAKETSPQPPDTADNTLSFSNTWYKHVKRDVLPLKPEEEESNRKTVEFLW